MHNFGEYYAIGWISHEVKFGELTFGDFNLGELIIGELMKKPFPCVLLFIHMFYILYKFTQRLYEKCIRYDTKMQSNKRSILWNFLLFMSCTYNLVR